MSLLPQIYNLFSAKIALQFSSALAEWSMWCNTPPQFVRKLEGGITNNSIVVRDDKQHYVLRINAFNSQALGLNRKVEQVIFQSASQANISSTFVYADPSERYLVCHYIHGRHLKVSDIDRTVSIQQLAQLVKSIHQLPAVNECLNIKQRINTYWENINNNHPALDDLRTLHAQLAPYIDEATSDPIELCICHHDLLPENLIITQDNKLLAIDWEYAAMGNPYFDLAVLIDGLGLNQQQSKELLTEYFEQEHQPQRLLQWQIIYRYISLLWYGVQCFQHHDSLYQHLFSEQLRVFKGSKPFS